MTNRERIEAYFDNELSSTEKESLLQEMESDSSLKSDFEMQKEIIEGIKAYRKEQLIAKLNTVKVSSVGQASFLKLAGILGAVAIISGGTLWYFYSNNNSIEPEKQEPNQEVVLEDTSPQINPEQPAIAEEPTEEVEISKPIEEPVESGSETVRETTKTEQSVTPEAAVPDLVEPDSDATPEIDENPDAPQTIATGTAAVTSTADIVVKLHKKYDFHYQVIGGDLTLYGEFDNSKFELIELNTNLGLKLYLFYDKLYYELKSDTEDIRPLSPVEDNEIIAQLDKRRL